MFKNTKFSLVMSFTALMLLSGMFGAGCRKIEIKDYAKWVNPFIGTGIYSAEGAMGEINCFPGPALPHGMVQLSPNTGKHIAGYMWGDKQIQGFSHTHVTGTGCWGFGNFLVIPTVGEVKTTEEEYASNFNRETEEASPGYYAVNLDDYGIKAELTVSRRAGFHRYTFPESDSAHLIIDVSHNLANDDPVAADVEVVDNKTVVGSVTIPNPFCGGKTPYTLYFAAITSKPFTSYGTWKGDSIALEKPTQSGTDIGAFLNFKTEEKEELMIKVGISYVSKEQAILNLRKEIPGWDFSGIKNRAREIWNRKLNTVQVKGNSEDDKIKFYTALYHSLLGPYTASDVNGKYRGMDRKVHTAKDHIHYHVYSLWDTFRSEHPLLVLIEPQEQNDMIKTLLEKQEQGGWLPRWEFANRYTNCMIADHATAVISDTYLKGIRNYNVEKAYQAMRKNAIRLPRSGNVTVMEGSFIPLQIGGIDKAFTILNEEDTLKFDWRWKYNDVKWHHFALTYEAGKEVVVYLDGKKVSSRSQDIPDITVNDQLFVIGSCKSGKEVRKYFTGNIDELCIYRKALSQSQIEKLFKGKEIKDELVMRESFEGNVSELLNLIGDPEFGEGRIGKSISFDGIDDNITLQPQGFPDGDALSLSFWIRTSLPTDFEGRRGLDYYIKYGYMPHDIDWKEYGWVPHWGKKWGWGAVSQTLENSYNDYALAQVAKEMEKEKDYQYFIKRAGYYRNLFDTTTGFMRPRNKDGSWTEPFDPLNWEGFTEGNSWTYTFFVPHDVKGLIELIGKDAFIRRLDHFFQERAYPKWSEPFSHYWHGNEPDQHVPYLYNYVGQPWKSQRIVRDIMDNLYGTNSAGIPGNEDVGQLSAWFVLSAMGFHPVAPGQPTYVIGSPLFDTITVYLDSKYYDSSRFTVIAENNSRQNMYIQSVTVNGKQYNKTWFNHSLIMEGGTIIFKMGPEPNTEWGSKKSSYPPSMSE